MIATIPPLLLSLKPHSACTPTMAAPHFNAAMHIHDTDIIKAVSMNLASQSAAITYTLPRPQHHKLVTGTRHIPSYTTVPPCEGSG